MKCLIHVGAHHTGTTSFQKLVNDQSDYLREIGIIYPESIKEGYQHSLLPGSFFPNHYALSDNRNLEVDSYIKRLNEEINIYNYELCFISSEVFTELLNNKNNELVELLNKLKKIFDEITIMYTHRDCKQKSFSAQRAQIRLSIYNPEFRSEIFNAPKRFQNKLTYSKNELQRWKLLKKKIIIANMEDSETPLLNYINLIISQLDLNETDYQKHSNYFREISQNGNYILNEDPYKPIIYLLVILIGLKIKNEENHIKDYLNLNLIVKYFEDCDPRIKKNLFMITKLNVINFLENYNLDIFEENKIIDTLKKAKFTFSSRVLILKLINDFILRLILLQ